MRKNKYTDNQIIETYSIRKDVYNSKSESDMPDSPFKNFALFIPKSMNKISDHGFVQRLLPDHYNCTVLENIISCRSNIGIPNDIEGEDSWGNIEKKIRDYFGKRLKEIKHRVKVCHIFFTLVLNPEQLHSE